MTKRTVQPPTSASMLAELVTLICDGRSEPGLKAQAITIAYEIGKSEGRLEGAISMGDRLVKPKPNHSAVPA
jgi:hypothetical protein